ncbi:PREDICTED: uncharacterized protein LOC109175136 [Ipomoea nil]|uniref:uncharacterized protein LOC109175136 n=1 Tax=Ipomoea nil TaxID=35883 RepID=UPI000901C803|nr:PREDICTED: uncharacterized protein LOC109175136 [Ipomoea nil]
MVSKRRPVFVFLIETKANSVKVEEVRIKLGFERAFCVDRVGLGGGLALFWRDSDTVTLLSYSVNHIDVIIDIPGRPRWRLTGFYGHPDRTHRQITWDLLRRLKDQSDLPWLVAGDFNDIAGLSEKRGIHSHPESLIEGFNDALGDCRLNDLGMVGGRFAWERGHGTAEWVEERLDRAVATMEWADLYEDVVVRNLHTLSSDHNALFIDVESGPVRTTMRSFKFESAWLLEEVVQRWSMKHGVSPRSATAQAGRFKRNRDVNAVSEYLAIRGELEVLVHQDELFWRQRSKQLWLKHEDANTKYFHKAATIRRKRNFLQRIKDREGYWREGSAMHNEIMRYFDCIFCSSNSSPDLFHRVQKQVTDEMNSSLTKPFTMVEVKTTLFSMAPDKAPGPDGMSPAFYQHFWPVLGHDLSVFILSCVSNRAFPPGFNTSNIVLLPKKKIPEKVSDLRPIALCNVVYKVLAKMLANRLKGTLEVVVSQPQSAFVPERLLTDNIIIAGEIGHYLRRKTCGNMGWTALKLDMAKAYDRMEWGFLEGMLGALGYGREWVRLLMLCVSTVNYTIQVNGEAVGVVCPTRGIRQGDPLSPYLFILCAEGLSILLQQAEARGDIHGIRVARGAPAVTHFFFADDSLLFFRALQSEALKIKECLDLYSAASGQLINFDKSNAVFSINTSPDMREHISGCIGVPVAEDLGTYLGLPSVLGRNKISTFKYIEDKLRGRIGMWQHKLLSWAGKEVLIKSIAQSLPIFTMSVFLLPRRTCDSIEKCLNWYWWGSGGTGQRGIHWLSWSRLCAPKGMGGLGFKKLHEFNIALLAKQGWRLLIHLESLVSRLLKAKYFPGTDFLEVRVGNNPSFLWHSIMAGQEILKLGVARRIGDGADTRIWDWGWLSDNSHPRLYTPCIGELQNATVSGLLNAEGNWDIDIVKDIFLEEDIQRILAKPVSCQFKDSWRWNGDLRGRYTVRHGYRLIMDTQWLNVAVDGFNAWKKLWSLPIPPKVKNLLWRCVRGVLPVRENLKTKHIWIGGGCPFCGFPAETVEHIFGECWYVLDLWEHVDFLQGRSLPLAMNSILNGADMGKITTMAAIVEVMWTTRNAIVWRNAIPTVMAMHDQVNKLRTSWLDCFAQSEWDGTSAVTVSWSPPPSGNLKCNVDAAIFSGGAGYGAVIRDHNGRFIAAKGGHIEGTHDPFTAEAIAVKEALSWLKGLIEKQCLSIANDIGDVCVRHVRRSANRVAHELARATGSSAVSGEWAVIPPTCISGFLNY